MKKLFSKSVAFALTGAMVLSMAQAGALPAKAQETLVATEDTVKKKVTQFMDCMDPMPIVGALSDSCWGAYSKVRNQKVK